MSARAWRSASRVLRLILALLTKAGTARIAIAPGIATLPDASAVTVMMPNAIKTATKHPK